MFSWRKITITILLLFFANLQAAPNKDVQLTQVANQIKLLQKKINFDREQQESLQQELETNELNINQLNQQVYQLNQAISHEQFQLNKLICDQNLLKKDLIQQQTSLTQQMQSVYPLTHIHFLKIILNQDNPIAIQRHLTYYRYLTQERLALIKTIKTSLIQLTTNMKTITQHQNNLKNLLSQKTNQQSQQVSAQKYHQQLLQEYKNSMQSKEDQLANLIANQHALSNIVSELNHNVQTTPPQSFTKLYGKLHWPVAGNVVANFGSLLEVGDEHLNGVIIQAHEGTPVKSIYNGKVIFANWLRGFGLLIIINHGNNFMSLYARNNTLLARVGDSVHTGDVIATTGNTGGFEKSSLYFEIRKNGLPLNPNIWCR